VPHRDPPVPTEAEYEAAHSLPFVWSLATASTLDVASFAYPSWTWLAESFAGKEIDTDRIWVGYAKANKYAHVYQDDGLHVDIAPYDGVEPDPPDEVHQELETLRERTWYALTDWPFYSGGGLGVVAGIDGSFAAEIDFSADRACQATMCELAVTNVDPGANQPPWNDDGTPRLPKTIRNKAAFYNPHGAPPFVGSEHDEDDGYRINWNLGSEYDDNQYGRPVGDGTVLSGRFRLERRANFFAAYYRNTVDATGWVCVGAVRNDSMNRRVFLRCAGKRWRQELETDPTQFYPVVANRFVFKDLEIARPVGS
jgi:hypothetical protein